MDLEFSWVIDGELAGSRGPRSQQDLVWLRQQKVGTLVRLVQSREARVDATDVKNAGMEDYNEPVPDFAAPTQGQIDRIVAYIDSHLENGIPVAVSCNAGVGRTGVILACYLVHRGFTVKDALELVLKKRARLPEVPEQIEAVETYSLRTKTR
jgi:atypical dual specificity phosphatase